VQYMEEDIPRYLAIRPAEIYSPKRRRRKLLEGKARISWPSKKRAGRAGTVGYGEERRILRETAIPPAGTKLRVSSKRGREEVLHEITGPSKASPPKTPTNTRSSKRVRLTTKASTVQERRRPTLHKPSWNAYESDSDASDSPSAGDGSDDQSGERIHQLGAKTKSAARTAAEKVEARLAVAKKAAATRAANHQALVNKITAELAEAQRAADAGGYRPGAVTKTQVKLRMKWEKEKMERENARERLEAAVAMREESAEAKIIAVAEKQAVVAKKRVATIAAKRAAISMKTQAGFQSTVATITTNTKIKKENKTAQERMVEVKAELAA